MFLAISIWGILKTCLLVLGFVFSFLVLNLLYFVLLSAWADKRTNGLAYFGLGVKQRRDFKKRLGMLSSLASPLLIFLSRLSPVSLEAGSLKSGDTSFPKHSCSPEKLAEAQAYQPKKGDVFVVTQMKCGTTWMLHVVYQTLMRGQGSLVEDGRSLHADVPWIESTKSVNMKDAPLIGDNPSRRIVKTHLPSSLCPFNREAKYIYVTRHPVSCFASTVDFVRTNLGPFKLPLETFESWFLSQSMWFSPWTAHVDGWWRRAKENANVLVLRFEDMKSDLVSIIPQVAEFLDVQQLDEEELALVAKKCSFEYMKNHAEAFEMSVPTVLQQSARLYVSGEIDRHADVPESTRRRLLAWCNQQLPSSSGPLAELYPDDSSASLDED